MIEKNPAYLELEKLEENSTKSLVRVLNDEKRLDLIEICRAIDYFFIGRTLGFVPGDSIHITEIEYNLNYGLNKAVYHTLDEATSYSGAPLFKSTEEIQQRAIGIIYKFGQIGILEYILTLSKLRLGEIIKLDAKHFCFKNLTYPIGVEYEEARSFNWLIELISEMQEPITDYQTKELARISREMRKLVDSWQEHYIQYTTSPNIDRYYQTSGLLHAQRLVGNDSFPNKTKFGGIEFGLYLAGIATLIGFSIKHLNFSIQLLRKKPEIDPHNIFTITSTLDDKAFYLSIALGIEKAMAEKIINTVTLSKDNKDEHCSVPGNMLTPIFITIGDGQLLCPLWGSLSNPIIFLLRELRRKYPSEWDRAVNLREDLFRDDLNNLFLHERFYKSPKSIKIKEDGKLVTDIDAIIYDKETKTLGLFQLKWQDPFGNSLNERNSKKHNLLHTGNIWVEKLSKWLKMNSTYSIFQALGMKTKDIPLDPTVRLFVLGRNFAHFSGDYQPDENAAWSLWPKFLQILSSNFNPKNPLDTLFFSIQEQTPLKIDNPDIESWDITLEDVLITCEAS